MSVSERPIFPHPRSVNSRRRGKKAYSYQSCTAAWLALACLCALAAPEAGPSRNALDEIRALLAEKAAWTPAQRKMESQLIHAMKRQRGEVFAPGAPNVEVDVKFQPDGRVLVDINAQVSPDLLALVAQGGGQVISSFPQFHAVRALVTPGQLETLADSAGVSFIRRAVEAAHHTGSVDSQGDITHLAAAARSLFGATGAGVKVGVLSDSVDYLANSQATGDLGTVTVLPGQSGTPATGEGTAMLEIIHDLAPNAQLFFATADGSEAGFAQNILDLRSSGCDIIVDDISYYDESPFQDGIVAQAVNTVTAGGALYFSSAANSGNLDSGTSGTWEGDFVDGGAVSSPETGRIHSFGAVTYNTVAPGGSLRRVDLFWSDPLGASANDYDLFVLDSTGTTVLRESTSAQTGTQDPYESISTLNVGERIVIVKYAGAARFLHLSTWRGQLTIATAGSTVGHSAATNAFSVAAVDSATAYPNPFTGGAANPVETFSSDGPRHVFFNADGSAMTPGNFSSSGGVVRQKPDVAAADDVATSVPGFASFPGTSAAAPHAAAIAALLKSYNPGLSPSQIRAILTTTALDIMGIGVDRDAGFGIVMAMAALQAAPPDALFITPGAGLAGSGPAGGPFSLTASSFALTNNGATAFNWSVVSTSLWLRVTPGSGTLTPGGPAATVTIGFNSASSNLASGTYLATLWFTNLTSHAGQSRQFTLSVTANPASQGAYANSLLALNPVAYWRLNETNPVPPADIVTNAGALGAAGNGFGLAGVVQGQPGIVGTCFRFSNSTMVVTYFGSHVDVPYQQILNPSGAFAVEFWAKPAQITTDLFCPAASVDTSQNGGNSRSGWIFYQATNTWQFRVGGLSGYTATLTGGLAQPNVWHHLAGVYDGANVSLFVDGQKVAGPTSAAGFSPNTTVAFRIGATTIPNRTFDGWVDEAAFYTNALSAATIAAHYSAATTNNPGYAAQILAASPVGYWRLDGPAYTAPAQNTLPQAANIGSLAPNANGFYEPGSVPGVAGVPGVSLGANNYACLFNGTGYLDVPATFLNLTGPLTMLAWVKANPANGNLQTVVSKGNSSYRLFLDGNGYPRFAVGAQSVGDVVGPNRVDDGQWHQWIGVYDGLSTETLYVDALLAASTTGATTPVAGNTSDVWIGGDPDPGAFHLFSGTIDEVALFTNALTAAQIQMLYSAATNTPSAPPQITGIVPTQNGRLTFTWSSLPGRSYQAQFSTDLTRTNWNGLGSPFTATDSTASASDAIGPDRQRFYRVVLLP